MEDESINIIRESTRNLLKLNRQMHKDDETNNRRCIQEIRITNKTIIDIANRLKTKSSISVSDLQTLKNGLIDDSKNIETFLNTHGALRGLIRELTGRNVKKQCEAAGCCCNLALGDSKACMTLAKAAGSYLTAALDNTTILAVTCAWTVGNLAGADQRICEILISQGALSKLSEVNSNEAFQDAALYALVHFTYQMKNDLRSDHLTKIIQTLSKLQLNIESAKLLFILSCHKDFNDGSQEILLKVLEDLRRTIESHTQMCSGERTICCKLVYLIRTLANMDEFYLTILKYIGDHNMYGSFRILLNSNKCITDSCLWLLGSLFNNCDQNVFKYIVNTEQNQENQVCVI